MEGEVGRCICFEKWEFEGFLSWCREVGGTEWLEIVIERTSCGEGERISNRTAGRIEVPFEVGEQ